MANYVLTYKGGAMAQTDAEREAAMAAWGGWLGGLGEALVDAGNPFGPAKSVAADGGVAEGGASRLTGYSIVQAAGLDAAVGLTKGCPVFAGGGDVEVYEAIPIM
jgi:hypothetical protein